MSLEHVDLHRMALHHAAPAVPQPVIGPIVTDVSTSSRSTSGPQVLAAFLDALAGGELIVEAATNGGGQAPLAAPSPASCRKAPSSSMT